MPEDPNPGKKKDSIKWQDDDKKMTKMAMMTSRWQRLHLTGGEDDVDDWGLKIEDWMYLVIKVIYWYKLSGDKSYLVINFLIYQQKLSWDKVVIKLSWNIQRSDGHGAVLPARQTWFVKQLICFWNSFKYLTWSKVPHYWALWVGKWLPV